MSFNDPFSPKAGKKTRDHSDMYTPVRVYLTQQTYAELRDHSRELGLPMSRLIAQALDNEMDCSPPFSYPCEIPTDEYVENAYYEEAQKIYDYLKRFNNGLSLDSLMLSRRDIGIEDRQRLMYGFRELVEMGMVTNFVPTKTKFKEFRRDYRHWMAKTVDKYGKG